MRTTAIIRRATGHAALRLVIPALAACSAETPPYDDLPLRDALSAAPEVLAALPEHVLHDTAARLEEAHRAGGEEAAIAGVEIASVAALVRGADAAREDRGEDAIVLGAIEPSTEGFTLRSLAAEGASGAALGSPVLKGQPASPATAHLEEAALGGRAGEIVAQIARRAEARELVRVTALPVGVVAQDHTVYVNASWLVALSALPPPDAPALPGPPSGAVALPDFPRAEPRSVRVNPYHLPSSVAACAAEVRDQCTCAPAGRCEHDRTDPGFASAQAECEWVNGDALNAKALCVLALMSIDALKECVMSAGSGACAALPIAGRDGALAFAADAGCMTALDNCLQYGRPTPRRSGSAGTPGVPSSPSSPSSDEGCSCEACNEDVDECNENCSDCNENCRDCNDNCRDCKQNCRSSDSSGNSGSSTSCRLSAGRRRDSRGGRPDAPLPGAALWLLAPAAYMMLRIRRGA